MFFDTVSKYVADRYMKFSDGEIRFGNQRIAFNLLPIMVKEFIINNEHNSNTYPPTLFLAARREGYDFIREHGIPLVKDWHPIVKMGFEWVKLFGSGTFAPARADNKEGFGVAIGISTFGLEVNAEMPSAEPVDFILGGLIAGTMQYYMKELVYAVETSCVAQKGVNECLIVVGTRENIMDYVKKFSPGMVEYGNRTLDNIQAVEKQMEDSGDKRWLL